MIRRTLIFIVAICMASAISAEAVRIRSGEHEGFTRIVFDMPKRVKWQLNNANQKAVLTFAGQAFEFDTSKIFNRLSKGRLGAISSNPDNISLAIELGCDCELTTFWYGTSSFVVDIRDAEERADQEKPVLSVDKTIPRKPNPRTAFGPHFSLPKTQVSAATSLTLSELSSDAPMDAEIAPETAAAPDPDTEFTPGPTSGLGEIRERLLQQIGRAASQGLLAPNVTIPGTPDQTDGIISPPLAVAPDAATALHINLQAQSSIDRDFLRPLSKAFGDSAGSACLQPEDVDVASWGSDEPFGRQIGAARIGLTGEFDEPNEAAAIELARLYLYFGFGVEARQALTMLENQTDKSRLLQELAAIIEHGQAPAGSVLLHQLNCGTSAALWSALSQDPLPSDVPIDNNAILLGFNALPPHLRRYLGPILSKRFLEAGYPQSSDRVLRILDRNDETTTPRSELVRAEIELADGAHSAADEILEGVVNSGSQTSAEAVLLRIETALAQDRGIAFEDALLAGAYAQENRHGPLGRSLFHVYVVSLAASGSYDKSYQELIRLEGEIGSERLPTSQTKILEFLAENADEPTFLKHIYSNYIGKPEKLGAHATNAAAKRLLTLGFSARSRHFLSADAAGREERIRAVLRAKASLLENRPRQAEVDLLGLTGKDVDLLRADARSRTGDHKTAAQLYALGNQAETANREAWLAQDWDMLKTASNSIFSDVAMMVAARIENSETGEITDGAMGALAHGKALIDASSSSREIIQSLLQTQPGPEIQTE